MLAVKMIIVELAYKMSFCMHMLNQLRVHAVQIPQGLVQGFIIISKFTFRTSSLAHGLNNYSLKNLYYCAYLLTLVSGLLP